jgi:ribonuclease HI
LDEKGQKFTPLWVPGQIGTLENAVADKEAKKALDENLLPTDHKI